MPLPQCFPPSRPSPYGLVRLPVSKHLHRGILPAARSSAVIVLLIVLVHFSLGILPCVITLHSFTTLVLYALKKNKKSAKVVRLMVSVKVRRLTPSASRNLDRHQHRTEKAVLFLFLSFYGFLSCSFSEVYSSVYSVEDKHIVTGSIGRLLTPMPFLLLRNMLSFCHLFA